MSLMSDSSKLLSFLLRFSRGMRRARLSIALVVATGVIAGLAGTVLLGLINAVLSRGGMAQRWQLLLFIGLCLALPLSRMASAAMLLHFSSRALAELRIRMARSVLALPLRTLEEKGAHRVLTALTQDISAIATAITNIPTLCMQVFIVLGSLAYLGWLSWKALLVVIVFLVVGIVTYQLPVSIAMRYFAIARQKIEELMKHFQAITEGAKELRLNRRRSTALLTQGIELAAHATQRSSFRAYTIYIGATSWGQMLFFVLIGAVLFAVPAVSSADRLVLTGYCLVILYMMTPLESIMTTLPTLGQAAVSVAAIEQLGLPLGEDLRQQPASPEVHASWRSIELKEVSYAYPREDGGVFTLGPLNLEIRPGRLVFLTGGNGSGKTTLAKLITGLYIPTQGEIRIDGEPVTEENRDGYRQLFSAVFFDFFLFEQLFAGEDRDVEERAREQLVRMQLAHKVEVHGDTLSTIDLSQGQRRRLALLSAVLEDRPIYVFDEWAADQDPEFRKIFYFHLLPELRARGKTVLVISHDERFFDVGDRVVQLEYGKLVEDRSPDEKLLAPEAAAGRS
jgi:putative ATP-binding cassette transporter